MMSVAHSEATGGPSSTRTLSGESVKSSETTCTATRSGFAAGVKAIIGAGSAMLQAVFGFCVVSVAGLQYFVMKN